MCIRDRPCEARRCFYEVVVPYAWKERENVAWCYGERCFESERYCERKREIEIFKISRKYEEFREKLGENYNENNDFITYPVVTNNTEGDRTITNHDRLYEFAENDENLNGICIYDVNIRDSIISNVYRYKIRLFFDDGG